MITIKIKGDDVDIPNEIVNRLVKVALASKFEWREESDRHINHIVELTHKPLKIIENSKEHSIDVSKLALGLQILCDKYGESFDKAMREEITPQIADEFFQCVIFGDTFCKS